VDIEVNFFNFKFLGIIISVIVLNLGMYLGVPAIVVIGIRKRF
jgi:hypothetical protein